MLIPDSLAAAQTYGTHTYTDYIFTFDDVINQLVVSHSSGAPGTTIAYDSTNKYFSPSTAPAYIDHLISYLNSTIENYVSA